MRRSLNAAAGLALVTAIRSAIRTSPTAKHSPPGTAPPPPSAPPTSASKRRPRRVLTAVTALGAVAALISVANPSSAAGFGETRNIWVDRTTIQSLPTTGAAWEGVVSEARALSGSANIRDNSNDHDVETLGGALYAVRMNDQNMKTKVETALKSAIGSERGGSTLALGRSLQSYVIAADVIGYRDAGFVKWVSDVRTLELDRTLVSTHEDRPNNWGTHAGASRVAADLYLGDKADLGRAVSVFRGWLGDRSAYAGFSYGDLDWQADPSKPVGINPTGSKIDGRNVDGALPDDQRRGGDFEWPPPQENYAWEAMQGTVVTAVLLDRAGYPSFDWSDRAIGRAATWLYDSARFPAEGDDTFIPFLLDYGLGTSYSDGLTARSGKGMGFTDWTHGERGTVSPNTTPVETRPTTAPTTTTEAPAESPSTTKATTTTTAPAKATTAKDDDDKDDDARSTPTSPEPTRPTKSDETSESDADDDDSRCVVILPRGGADDLESAAKKHNCRIASWQGNG